MTQLEKINELIELEKHGELEFMSAQTFKEIGISDEKIIGAGVEIKEIYNKIDKMKILIWELKYTHLENAILNYCVKNKIPYQNVEIVGLDNNVYVSSSFMIKYNDKIEINTKPLNLILFGGYPSYGVQRQLTVIK